MSAPMKRFKLILDQTVLAEYDTQLEAEQAAPTRTGPSGEVIQIVYTFGVASQSVIKLPAIPLN